MLTIVLKSAIHTGNVGPVLLTIGAVHLTTDPLSFVLPKSEKYKVAFAFVRFIPTCGLCWLGWYIFNMGIILLASMYVIVGYSATLCVRFTKFIMQETNRINDQLQRISINTYCLVQRAVKTHVELRISQCLVNDTLKSIVPALLFNLQVIFISCNYRSLRHLAGIRDVPLITRFLYPCMSLIALIAIVTILTLSCQAFEGSKGYLDALQQLSSRSKYFRRALKSQSPIKAYLGSFCHSKRSTKSSFFCSCIDASVNALLLF